MEVEEGRELKIEIERRRGEERKEGEGRGERD